MKSFRAFKQSQNMIICQVQYIEFYLFLVPWYFILYPSLFRFKADYSQIASKHLTAYKDNVFSKNSTDDYEKPYVIEL